VVATLVADKPRKVKGKPGPKPNPSKVRDAATMVRSSQGWKETVERLADFDRAPSVSDLIDRALAHYSEGDQLPRADPQAMTPTLDPRP